MNSNLVLLALAQGLFLTNNIIFIAINGLVGLSMAPLGWMATLPVMGYVVGGAASTSLVARTQERYGRKVAFQIGLAVGFISCGLCALAAMTHHFWGLVFSTFVSALQLLKEALEDRDIPYCYLDGSTKDRQGVCDTFNSTPAIPVMLMSLKAGGTGLNLTAADTVVHFDPWWNPAAEAQATDRAHRIGQTRIVTSYKLIAAGTVEEKVLGLQESKRALLADVFEASDAAAAKLSLADLKALL